ncbi:hypothetical protein DB346_23115 [Verrucomicrobia bacterium LW23]|nr:hypothetical protein DB346_23115 [Verrucomicrobia bacterium LW23]
MPGSIIALVVEDNKTIVAELRDRLGSMRHKVVVASNQLEADNLMDDTLFDYVLLDINIPSNPGGRPREQNGRNLLASIRKRPGYSGIPIIITTAYGSDSPDLAVSLMKLGATDFINKPFDNSKVNLESKIQDALIASLKIRESSLQHLKPFTGGELVFFPEWVELHFDRFKVRVSGYRKDALMRSILEFLRKKYESGDLRSMSGKVIAENVNAGFRGDAAVREAFYTFRSLCSSQLAAHGYRCERHDIIANENHNGYHFSPKIRVREGDLAALPPEVGPNSKERAICLALVRGQKTRRQIANRMGFSVEEIKDALRKLVEAGIVRREGSGSSAIYSLPSGR